MSDRSEAKKEIGDALAMAAVGINMLIENWERFQAVIKAAEVSGDSDE